ncbi:helix-turn-helix domain-containing protein, partial [Enterococcus faecium]|uniref:helix-turn-helix domain-containing protein n=1 Tax=Enterococcus faecium TaxID=1352 RepID=UPI001EE848FA
SSFLLLSFSIILPYLIVDLKLCNRTEMCVCDLAEILTASVATTSHHLRFLKKHGMAKSRQDGKVVYYSLANEDILSAIRVF